MIFSFTGIPYIVQEYDHILEVMQMYEVDISTICQCTGLKDKNDKLIWENDICDRKEQYPEIVEYGDGDWTLDYSYVSLLLQLRILCRRKKMRRSYWKYF